MWESVLPAKVGSSGSQKDCGGAAGEVGEGEGAAEEEGVGPREPAVSMIEEPLLALRYA
jgi:hypothetical protein